MLSVFLAKTLVWNSELAEMCCDNYETGKKACACEGIVLPDAQLIRGFEEGDGYKYLGILEAGDVKHNDMKQSISKEYLRRIRKIL